MYEGAVTANAISGNDFFFSELRAGRNLLENSEATERGVY